MQSEVFILDSYGLSRPLGFITVHVRAVSWKRVFRDEGRPVKGRTAVNSEERVQRHWFVRGRSLTVAMSNRAHLGLASAGGEIGKVNA